MSGEGGVDDYAIILFWLGICSAYTTLLAVTALSVILILKKRRSSILKSHRLTRTPFSELEFKVATPTDSQKSRRVSFSKRKDVAEFITNEATTTWKNFYEEHNKSLDHSGNDSGKPVLQAPDHIGQRFFEDQFQISEIDLEGNLNTTSHGNLTEQLLDIECNNGRNKSVLMRQKKFELSCATEHQTKLFGDDVTNPIVGDVSGEIEINFSAVQPIVNRNDDPDDMLKSDDISCGPFKTEDISCFSMGLNITDSQKEQESDMSITDTIHNAKVQIVAENNKKELVKKDWAADKENVAINPYIVSPKEKRYTLNEEPDKVLVFDGKKLILQSNKELEKTFKQDEDLKEIAPKRKSSILKVIDNLSEVPNSQQLLGQNFTIMKDMDLSNTGPVLVEAPLERRRTVVFDNSDGNISLTRALSTNMVLPKSDTCSAKKTVVYEDDDCNLSMTNALPSKMLFTDNKNENVYSNSNISLTRALPTNIVDHKSDTSSVKTKTVVYDDDNDNCNLSMTHPIPAKMLNADTKLQNNAKRRTVVFDNDENDISITRALPLNILPPNTQRRQTIVYDNNDGDVSITEAIPQVILSDIASKTEKRRTIVYEADNDVSMTQALPTNIVLNQVKRKSVYYSDDLDNISMTQAIPNNVLFENKTNTTFFDEDCVNVSITQGIPLNIVQSEKSQTCIEREASAKNKMIENRRTTMIFDDNCGNISMTQALPPNIVQSEKSKTYIEREASPKNKMIENRRTTMIFDDDCGNISMTQALPPNIVQSEKSKTYIEREGSPKNKMIENRRTTMIFDDDCGNISMTQALPPNIVQSEKSVTNVDKRRTIVFEYETGDISMTQALPENVILHDVAEERKIKDIIDDTENVSIPQSISPNIILTETPDETNSIVHDSDQRYVSPSKNHNRDVKRQTIVYENSMADISMTEHVPTNVILKNLVKPTEKEYVEKADMSITQTIVPEIIGIQEKTNRKSAIIDKSVAIINPKSFHDFKIEANKSKNLKFSPTKSSAHQDLIVYQTSTNQNPTKHQITASIERIDSRIDEIISTTDPKEKIVDQEESLKRNFDYLENKKEKMEIEMMTEHQKRDINEEEEIKKSIIESVPNNTKPMNSLINNLLDMSNASLDKKIDETEKDDFKSAIVNESEEKLTKSIELMTSESIKSESNEKTNNEIQNVEDVDRLEPNISSESMFCIIKDSEPTSPDPRGGHLKHEELESPKESEKNIKLSPNKEKRSPQSQNLVEELQNKLEIIKSVVEDIPITNLNNRHYEKIVCSDETLINSEIKNSEGDSKKILEFLTKQTEKKDESIAPIAFKDHIAIENKSQMISLPSRQSFITREELLNNISMAQAMLKSRCENSSLDDTSGDVTTDDTSQRFNTSIKRTLNFGDDSLNDVESTPLKKTAFGETSYMKEPKGNVIPSYLQDATEEIKELMHDLVKPNAEFLQYEEGLNNSLKRTISTCSNQIQVNLTTSSQIDLDVDTDYSERYVSSDRSSFGKGASLPYHKPIMDIPSQESSYATKEEDQMFVEEQIRFRPKRQPIIDKESPIPERVLVFDQFNPLNNVLLQPVDFSEVHTYNPIKPVKLDTTDRNICTRGTDVEVVRVSARYNLDTNMSHSGDDCLETAESRTNSLSKSTTSSSSKPTSIDQSIDVRVSELRDIEVNTMIAMKENKVLLQASSSLTLVDDAISHMDIDMDVNDKMADIDNDDYLTTDSEKTVKAKKRNRSPKKDGHKKFHSDIALKPVQKMQKISYSPKNRKSTGRGEVVSSLRKSDRSSGQNMDTTVHQLLTQFRMHSEIDHKKIDNEILEALSKSSSATMDISIEELSFRSSKNQIAMRQRDSVTSQSSEHTDKSDGSGVVNSDSSKNFMIECEPSVNVVAKINMQSFMGRDCEWEESGNDAWSFRLLRRRIRVLAQLSHRPEQAARTHVRADTPIVLLKAEAVSMEKRRPMVDLCVQYALEATRQILAREESALAASLPALLRRCAALSRLAERWARAMHEASVRLVYRLTHDGSLSLKVANIGLRSVWEIRMKIEMVTEGVTPYPKATNVQIVPVVVSERYSESELKRLIGEVPCDWGHVPKTIWRVFKYLKNLNKMDDDDIFLKL